MEFKTKYDIVFQNMDTLAPYFFIFFFWGGEGKRSLDSKNPIS